MEKKTWTSIGILIVLVVVFLYLFIAAEPCKKPEAYKVPYIPPPPPPSPPPPPPPPCGCVFDIDDTLTCGDPTTVIRMCKDNGCILGLNTARNRPYALDVPLKEQGFPPNVLNSEDFVYNPNPTLENVMPTKVAGLRAFQYKWKIDSPSKILFFDDNFSNIEGANAAGFKGVWCPKTYEECGVGAEQEKMAGIFLNQILVSRPATARTEKRQHFESTNGQLNTTNQARSQSQQVRQQLA